MSAFTQIGLVGFGGAIGAILRYAIGTAFNGKSFPYATLLINFLGSLIIGYILSYTFKNIASKETCSLLLATGFCGGFTTFSAFSWEQLQMLQQGKIGTALFYAFVSLAFCTFATYLGTKLNS